MFTRALPRREKRSGVAKRRNARETGARRGQNQPPGDTLTRKMRSAPPAHKEGPLRRGAILRQVVFGLTGKERRQWKPAGEPRKAEKPGYSSICPKGEKKASKKKRNLRATRRRKKDSQADPCRATGQFLREIRSGRQYLGLNRRRPARFLAGAARVPSVGVRPVRKGGMQGTGFNGNSPSGAEYPGKGRTRQRTTATGK
jgi:hypothetical protein